MRKARALAVIALGVGIGLFACNVFVAVDRCESDADCALGATCDSVGRYCVSPPDTGATDAADAADVIDAADAHDARDAGPAVCDTSAPFTTFSLVGGLESTPILTARLTSDERNVVYSALHNCTDEACLDLFVAARADLDAAFAAGSPLAGVNCNMSPEYWPTLSADGKLIFFESSRALVPSGGNCGFDISRIWSSTRVSTSTDFGPPSIDAIFAHDATIVDSSPYLLPNGRTLYFVSLGRNDASATQDIYVASIDPLGLVTTVSLVAPVASDVTENFPVITVDDLTLYFARGDGARVPWVTHRASTSVPFDAPKVVPGFDPSTDVIPAWISDDACRFYFVSNRESPDGGGVSAYRLWVASREPETGPEK